MTTILLVLALTADPWAAIQPNPWEAIKPVVQSGVQEPTWTKLANPVTLPSSPYDEIHFWKCGQFYNDVHEQSHFVMNWFSNSWGLYSKKQQALYCLKGRIAILDEPPLTIDDVAKAVPVEKRQSGYESYLVKHDRNWNKTPLYLLNEWVSYSNEWEYDHTDIGLRHAVAFCDYADTLLSLAEKCQGYDCTKLRTFIVWHKDRVQKQQEEAKTLNASKPAVSAPSSSCPSGNCPSGSSGFGLRWR
jgi:hypothetical protein